MIKKILFLFIATSFSAAYAEVVLPLKAIPNALNLHKMPQVDQYRVSNLVAEGLFEMGQDLQLDPRLASKASWSKDGKRLRVKIRDAKFSNGSVVTIDSVVSALESCIRLRKNNQNVAFQAIEGFADFKSGKDLKLKGLKPIGTNELEILLDDKRPMLVEDLSARGCSIVKTGKNGSRDLLKGAKGTGPYYIKYFDSKKIVLEKNQYYPENTGPRQVVFRSTDHMGNLQELKDAATLIITEKSQAKLNGYTSFQYSRLGNYQLSFNNSAAPFDNKNLRKAVSIGVDLEYLAKTLDWDLTRIQKGLIPFGMRGFKHRSLSNRNVSLAKKLLKKSGYSASNPFTFTILMAKANGTQKEADAWPKAFSGLPIRVKVEALPQKEIIKRRSSGDFHVIRHGKAPGSLDPHLILKSYLKGAPWNTPRINLPKCDRLTKSALTQYDLEKRHKLYHEAESCLLNSYAILPLTSLKSGTVLVKQPWALKRRNQYSLYPYSVHEWVRL